MKKVLYTSADENTPWWDRHTKVMVEAYCEKHGIELINLPCPTDHQPQWVIFDAFRASLALPEGSVAGWIDSDIVVLPDAPDILNVEDKFYFCSPEPVRRVHPNAKVVAKLFGLPSPRPYIISAMARWKPEMVVALVKWFDENKGKFRRIYGDQELLMVGCYETKTHFAYFPNNWHRMYKWCNRKVVGFMHAAGNRKGWKVSILARKMKAMTEGKPFKINSLKGKNRKRDGGNHEKSE